MKFLHTADLHIGKKIFERSMIEDQAYILSQILQLACKEQVDAVLIAGDVYDRAVPSTEAVALLDDFLTRLQEAGITVIMISGNHDSPERVSFAGGILEKQGLYIAGNYQEPLKTVILEDAYGPVSFVCMPFVKPTVTGSSTSKEAVEHMLATLPVSDSARGRSVLLTHYFVIGENGEEPELSDSETDVNVGGLDSVPASCLANFSYVALGHIHKPQHIGKGQVYYSGSPLKYSFSEARGDKAVNIVELGKPGEITVTKHTLKPLREMRCIKGRLDELIATELLEELGEEANAYIQATLTDTEELIDPMSTLRSVYPNALQIILEKRKLDENLEYESRLCGKRKSTTELFAEFYEMLRGEEMDAKRNAVVEEAAEEAERTVL